MREEDGVRFKLDILLKHAELFQSEMNKRLERQAQSFYFCTLLLAAVFTGAATAKEAPSVDVILSIFAWLPVLTTPLAAMFFDDELALGVSDCHFHHYVVREIQSLLSDAQCSGDNLMDCTLTSRFVFIREVLKTEYHVKIDKPRLAADTRRFIFALPFLFAVFAAVSAIADLTGPFTQVHVNLLTRWVCGAGFALDVYLFVRTRQMWKQAATAMQAVTRKPSRRTASAKASSPA